MKNLTLQIGLLGLVVEDLQVDFGVGLGVDEIRTGVDQVSVVFYSFW